MQRCSQMTPSQYHAVSDTAMDRLLDSLETMVDSSNNPQYEVEYHSGVLTLNLGDKGTYVVNKQPPNQQIWLSSPLSGPKRYDYDVSHKVWFYSRDHQQLQELLEEELGTLLDTSVSIDLED
ncbi:hypothetical protein BKA62DRAFT_614808 [Auriculariales sp. MPI-PUGE-AT-0066]|nr:hypothetical protein BKA62DRAFT_614808 [Auriculariales sp. MPI-PUGE-AT-0066]